MVLSQNIHQTCCQRRLRIGKARLDVHHKSFRVVSLKLLRHLNNTGGVLSVLALLLLQKYLLLWNLLSWVGIIKLLAIFFIIVLLLIVGRIFCFGIMTLV